MARQQRTTTDSFAQESPSAIVRVALYARVSTLNNQDPEMQLAELREYAGRRGWQIVEEYTDQGVSGCKESRPALNRMMSDACRRRFDAVLVWKIDRFGRSLKHLVNALAELAALGVAFISLRDNLDLSTPSGRLMFQIIGAMAEFERALIQERVRAGIRNARAKGKRLGRPRVIVDASRVAFQSVKRSCRYRTITGIDWPETGLEEINADLLETDFWPGLTSDLPVIRLWPRPSIAADLAVYWFLLTRNPSRGRDPRLCRYA